MSDNEFYKNGITSSGRGFCWKHGWIASLDSEGNIWCPYCGWVNRVPYKYDSQTGRVNYLYDDDD